MTADREAPRAWAATRSNVDRAQFLRTGRPPASVRTEIAASWRRSVTLGKYDGHLDPTRPVRAARVGPCEPDTAPGLEGLARRVNELTEPEADAAHLVLLLTDTDGVVVARQVAHEQARSATDVGLFPGQALTEGAVGTNAVALCLATAREAHVVGAEHLLPEWTSWSSTAGTVRDPAGHVIGCLAVFERDTRPRATAAWLRLAIALVELELQRGG